MHCTMMRTTHPMMRRMVGRGARVARRLGTVMRCRARMPRRLGMTGCAPRMMIAHVDPTVAWARARHWREWRRRRQRLGLRSDRRLRFSGDRLLAPRSRPVRDRLLRRARRNPNRKREHCANHDDTLHDSTLPFGACAEKGEVRLHCPRAHRGRPAASTERVHGLPITARQPPRSARNLTTNRAFL